MGKHKFNKANNGQQGQARPNGQAPKEEQAADVAVMEQPEAETLVVEETANLQNIAADVEYLDEEKTDFFLGFKFQMEEARQQMVEVKVATTLIDILLAELYSLIEEVPGEPTMSQEEIAARMQEIEEAANILQIDLLTAALPVAEEYRQLLEGTPEQTEESYQIAASNKASLNELCESTLALGKFFRKQMITEGKGAAMTVAWAYDEVYPSIDAYTPVVLG